MTHIQLNHQQFLARQKAPSPRFPFCILLHDMEQAINVGSVFRLADALALEKIWLTGSSPVPPDPKIRRSARATEQHVPFSYCADPLQVVAQCRAQGYTIVSLELTNRSIDVRALALPPDAKICLILGSENTGVAQELLTASDHTVHLPMLGQNSSMNVATACAMASFELLRAVLPISTPAAP